MRVRWLKDSEVIAGATTHLKGAKLSVQKWFTFGHCSKKTLIARENDGMDCGLCVFHKNLFYGGSDCDGCILRQHTGYECNDRDAGKYTGKDLYAQAINLLYSFYYHPTQTGFIKFQKKARKLWRVLVKCVEILEKK